MKTINDNPDEFFENGGWSFLIMESDVSHLIKAFPYTPKCIECALIGCQTAFAQTTYGGGLKWIQCTLAAAHDTIPTHVALRVSVGSCRSTFSLYPVLMA